MRTAGGTGGSGFGGAGFGTPDDFGALAQRYWTALGDAMRSAGGSGARDPWRAAIDGWTQMLGGAPRNDATDAIERFSAQARQWLGAMQQVAGQFAGHGASAGDIVAAWKQALGDNPFGDLFSTTAAGLSGRGQSGFEQWFAEVAPFLGGLRREGMDWMRLPAFGPAREHQERWQALAEAQLELQRRNDEYAALLLEANNDAFERFERKLAERSEPGRQLQSARALFDLWIDAAEEAYAEIALSARFRRIYGDLVNAQMRVRAGIQGEVERLGNLFGMPGRTEVDAAHRRIAELERQVRRLSVAARTGGDARRPAATRAVRESDAPAPSKPSVKRTSSKPAPAKKTVAEKAAAKKPGEKTSTGKKTAAPARAAAGAASRRAPRPAIAVIAMPDPLKPMPKQAPSSSRTANRKR
ncbi:MAG: class III poly(R)-hydroxyalkanoic acid synthase subunit PhaE [Pseudomonadota bacterium]